MATSSTMPLVRKVAIKQQDGGLGADNSIGASFMDVADVDRVGATGYTLDQFFDSYMKFMDENCFVYSGDIEPTNHHISIWLDTSTTNQG